MNIKKEKNLLLLLLILIFASFLRFYQLGNIPSGLTNDEANKGYEAYSILQTGKDQWGNLFPLTSFKGFGDYPPPLYIYANIPSILFFGLNQFSVRLASAIAGVLSIGAIYFLGKKIFNGKVGILSALFLAIMPWAIGLSRIGIESNLAILFLISTLYFGINPKSLKYFYFSVFLLILLMYTYSGYALFSPIVFIFLLFLLYKQSKIKIKNVLALIVIFLIFTVPLFIHGSASARFSQVGILHNINSIGLFADLNTQRGQCLEVFSNLVCKIANNKPVLIISTILKNYLFHFSPIPLYISGSVSQYSILPQRGLDYLFNSIFIIFGIFSLFKNNNYKFSLIFIGLFLLSALPDSLTGDGNYSRASIMIPFIAILNGLGFVYFLHIVRSIKSKSLNFFTLAFTIFIIVFSLGSFYITYLTYFKNNYSIFSQYGYKDLMVNVAKERNNYERIYISRHLSDTKQYIYYLFYNKYPPLKYQSKKDVEYNFEPEGWVSVNKLENIYFILHPDLIKDDVSLSSKKILVISNPKDFPITIKPVFTVKDNLGNVLFKAINLSNLLEYERKQKLIKTDV